MKFKAALFDLDGTLMDSEDVWWASFNEVLLRHKKKAIGREEFKQKYSGKYINDDVKFSFPEADQSTVDAIAEEWKAEFRLHIHSANPIDGAVCIVNSVKNLGLKVGLVTNTDRDLAMKVLSNMRIVNSFDASVCGGETTPKPSPDPVLKCCSLLGVVPKDAFYVEDSVSGVAAGKSAGCFTIGIVGTTTRESLELAGADMVITNLSDINEIL